MEVTHFLKHCHEIFSNDNMVTFLTTLLMKEFTSIVMDD